MTTRTLSDRQYTQLRALAPCLFERAVMIGSLAHFNGATLEQAAQIEKAVVALLCEALELEIDS